MKISQSKLDVFWIVITALVFLFMLVVIGRNSIHAVQIKRQIAALEYEADYHRKHIAADSTLLEQLKDDGQLERYAREHYRMKREGEDLYIVEQ